MALSEGASFPCCRASREYCACLERVCARNHTLVCHHLCSPKQSSLIHLSARKRARSHAGCICCRSERIGFPSFRLVEQWVLKKTRLGGNLDFDYGVEFHSWVQEMLSLLATSGSAKVPFWSIFTDFCSDPPPLCCDREHGSEKEFRLHFEQWCFSGDSNRKPATKNECKCQKVSMVGGRTRNGETDGRYLRQDEDDDDDSSSGSTQQNEYDYKISAKRKQRKREMRGEPLVKDEHSTGHFSGLHRHRRSESHNPSSRANNCYSGRKEAFYEAKNTRGTSIMVTERGRRQQTSSSGGRHFIRNDEKSNQRVDEIKVCVDEREDYKSSSRKCTCSCHENQVGLKIADSKVNRTDVVNEMQGEENVYSQLMEKGMISNGGIHRSGGCSTAGYVAQDHHLKHLQESNSIFERKCGSARISEREKLQEEDKPQYSQSTSGVSISMGGVGKSSTSEYIARSHHSEHLEEPSISYERRGNSMLGQIPLPGTSVHRPEFTMVSAPNDSSGRTSSEHVAKDHDSGRCQHELNINAQIGATLSEQIILQESSTHFPYNQGSSNSTCVGQATGHTGNEGLMESSQHAFNVHTQGETSMSISEPKITSDSLRKHAYPTNRVSDSSSTISLNRYPDKPGEHSLGKLEGSDLFPERFVERSEKIHLIEREKTSETTTLLQHVVMESPPSQPNLGSIRGGSGENVSEDFWVQSSWLSPASAVTTGPSDEMWHVAQETFEENSSETTPEYITANVAMSCGENLAQVTSNREGIGRESSRSPIGKRSSRSLWNCLGEIIKSGWAFEERSQNSGQSAEKISLTESGSSASGSSGHEPDDEVQIKEEKKDLLKRSPAIIGGPLDEDTGSNMGQRHEISRVLESSVLRGSSDDRISRLGVIPDPQPGEWISVQSTIVTSGRPSPDIVTTSSMGVPDRGSIRRNALTGCSLPKPNSRSSSDIVISAGISDVKEHITSTEVEFTGRMKLQPTAEMSEISNTSSMGLSDCGSIQRRASTSPLLTSSGKATLDIVISTGASDVQERISTTEAGTTPLEIPRVDMSQGYHEPVFMNGETGDTENEDMQRILGESKLKRTPQVQREGFEAWEEAYRIETEQRKMDGMFMKEALVESRKAADTWEVPVGAVLVQDGKIIARGHNLVEELRDSTAHAEMVCIRDASKFLRTWHLAGTTLYVTLEPCAMCAGAILQARIETLVWGAPNKLLGADGSWTRLFPFRNEGQDSSNQPNPSPGPRHPFHPNMKVRRGVLATECSDVMQQFFQLRRKRVKTPDGPPSLPVATIPTKSFSKMHNLLSVLFCL